jgi:hypothetical protein
MDCNLQIRKNLLNMLHLSHLSRKKDQKIANFLVFNGFFTRPNDFFNRNVTCFL